MDRTQLRELQAPLKERYREKPATAEVVLRARGSLGEGLSCSVETASALVNAGLHPATGGNGLSVCSGDMLLQALVACAGVTLSAVATSLGMSIRGGTLEAAGVLDFRGTLGVSKEAPVGFKSIELLLSLDTDASDADRLKLLELTERYCVVYQTLMKGVEVKTSYRADSGD